MIEPKSYNKTSTEKWRPPVLLICPAPGSQEPFEIKSVRKAAGKRSRTGLGSEKPGFRLKLCHD